MENFGGNFRGAKSIIFCHLCSAHLDSLEMSFYCQEIIKKLRVGGNPSDTYEEKINIETIETISEEQENKKIRSNRKETYLRAGPCARTVLLGSSVDLIDVYYLIP